MNGKRRSIGFGIGSGLCALLSSLGALGCSASTAVLPASPTVAFGATASDVEGGCVLDGTPRVLATHVRPMDGITAVAQDGVVWLRFATTHDPRVAVAVDPETLQVVEAGEPPTETAADAVRGPIEVELPDHQRLVAWTDQSAYESRVKAVTIADQGMALGETIDLGFRGSAIGRPAAAFGARGKGLLAFIESNEIGFEVVVVRASCPSGG
jgi:hypothetical protein